MFRNINKILIITGVRIGDQLMHTPFFRAMRKAFPSSKISLATDLPALDVLKNNPNIDEKKSISIRLEGGIGDHILGLRILLFIRQRYPHHKIIAYSDCAGHQSPLEIARLSPFLTEVIPVYHKKNCVTTSNWGSLNNIQKKYLDMMFAADLFFDTWGKNLFIEASRMLGIHYDKILSQRPRLVIPSRFKIEAVKFLSQFQGCSFVGLSVAKYDLKFLQNNRQVIQNFIKELLRNPKVTILNFYTLSYEFPHWPKSRRLGREKIFNEECIEVGELWNINRRVIPVVDFSISMVAALLERCSYFVGVDNGIKHLAWALGIPLTYFVPFNMDAYFKLRWMPDHKECLLFNCSKEDFSKHLLKAKRVLMTSFCDRRLADRKQLLKKRPV